MSDLRKKENREYDNVLATIVNWIENGKALQAFGHDGWAVTVGPIETIGKKGFGNSFDPPSGYEDTFFKSPKIAAKIYIDAVGPDEAIKSIERKL